MPPQKSFNHCQAGIILSVVVMDGQPDSLLGLTGSRKAMFCVGGDE